MNRIKVVFLSLFLINYIKCDEYNNNLIIVDIQNSVNHDEMVKYIFFHMDYNQALSL